MVDFVDTFSLTNRFLYTIDFVLDIVILYQYLKNGDWWYFGLTFFSSSFLPSSYHTSTENIKLKSGILNARLPNQTIDTNLKVSR